MQVYYQESQIMMLSSWKATAHRRNYDNSVDRSHCGVTQTGPSYRTTSPAYGTESAMISRQEDHPTVCGKSSVTDWRRASNSPYPTGQPADKIVIRGSQEASSDWSRRNADSSPENKRNQWGRTSANTSKSRARSKRNSAENTGITSPTSCFLQKAKPTETKTTGRTGQKFYTYMKHCKRDSIGVAPLRDTTTGLMETDPLKKASLLNPQFQSVVSLNTPLNLIHICFQFIRRNTPFSTPENLHHHQQQYPTLPEFTIYVNGVKRCLRPSKPHKAAGPGQIRPLIQGNYQENGNLQMLFQFTIRDLNTYPSITGRSH